MRNPSYEEDLKINIEISFKTERRQTTGPIDCSVVLGTRHGKQWKTEQEADKRYTANIIKQRLYFGRRPQCYNAKDGR